LHPDIQSSTFTVNAGDRLVFYTDGLLEARDRTGQFFRLEDCLDALRHPDLEASADELLSRLLAHARRKLNDDVALLLVEATSPRVWPDSGPALSVAPRLPGAPEGSPVTLAGATFAPATPVR
jgi:serine/threonine protein phosphatase PrpC